MPVRAAEYPCRMPPCIGVAVEIRHAHSWDVAPHADYPNLSTSNTELSARRRRARTDSHATFAGNFDGTDLPLR